MSCASSRSASIGGGIASGSIAPQTAATSADERAGAASIQGQLLRRSERRQVAIYLRDDELWVADFVDGEGHLIDVATWLRFNCATLVGFASRRRMLKESAFPLSADLVARIELLHRPQGD